MSNITNFQRKNYDKKYRQTHKENIAIRKRNYYENYKEEKSRYNKEYYQNNKNKMKEQCKNYYENHEEEIKQYQKEYRKRNQKDLNIKKNKYLKNRMKKNINFKLTRYLRTRINTAIKDNQKSGSAVKDLGCSISELKTYLESKFQKGMSWKNWSKTGWHIDHIVPLNSFNLQNREEFLKANQYTNLQPLWAEENLKKGG